MYIQILQFLFSQWTIVICGVVALNWWIYPITRVTNLKQEKRSSHCEKLLNLFIRNKTPQIQLPPTFEDTPTSSEATTYDEDSYMSDEFPMKGNNKSTKEKVLIVDAKL